MMRPIERHCVWLSADEVQLMLSLPVDLFWFQGHFESQRILPGVAQVDWVLDYAQTLFGIRASFGGLDQVKFQSPVRPGETVRLSLHRLDDKTRLDFVYELEIEGKLYPVSRGRVRFTAGDTRE